MTPPKTCSSMIQLGRSQPSPNTKATPIACSPGPSPRARTSRHLRRTPSELRPQRRRPEAVRLHVRRVQHSSRVTCCCGQGGRGGPPQGNGPAPGSTCGAGPNNSSDGALPGRTVGQPGGPNAPGPGRGPQPDAATQLTRSDVASLQNHRSKNHAGDRLELDPGIEGKMSAFNQAFHDELCKEGPDHCPVMLFEKGESHMSEVFSIDTPDKTVSGPILAWIKKIK